LGQAMYSDGDEGTRQGMPNTDMVGLYHRGYEEYQPVVLY